MRDDQHAISGDGHIELKRIDTCFDSVAEGGQSILGSHSPSAAVPMYQNRRGSMHTHAGCPENTKRKNEPNLTIHAVSE